MTRHDSADFTNLKDGSVCAVFVAREAANFLPTILSLKKGSSLTIVAAAPKLSDLEPLDGTGIGKIEAVNFSDMVNRIWEDKKSDIIAIYDAVLVPPHAFEPAIDIVRQDLRISSVSFLSNSAGELSFPWGSASARIVEGHDEASLTAQLRELSPGSRPAPVPSPEGAAVLLASGALSAVGPLREPAWGSAAAGLADFSMRARKRGFVDVADMSTFVARRGDLTIEPTEVLTGPTLGARDFEWVSRANPALSRYIRQEEISPHTPKKLEFKCSASKVVGLNIIVDGTCLGPQQMGTQVATLALVGALAKRQDVRKVCVLLAMDAPAYAEDVLRHEKVQTKISPELDPRVFGTADIGHRPFQPNEHFRPADWRSTCRRVVISLLDLIAYQISSYHDSEGRWVDYRDRLVSSLKIADAVLGIGPDVKHALDLHRLPLDPSRFFVVNLGTDHLTGHEKASPPRDLHTRGFAGEQFLVTLGATYSHKNRDLAIKTHRALLERGRNLALVFAGAQVPSGSSAVEEAMSWHEPQSLFVLPDIRPEERNWLLKHAAAVLYPTSAEGFGLLPYEAAQFGTPTVHVGFGALSELSQSVPVTAADWSPGSFADAVERLLDDPALGRQQVEATLSGGAKYTWDAAAAELTGLYRTILARPPVVKHMRPA